jgi:hypothetical protein
MIHKGGVERADVRMGIGDRMLIPGLATLLDSCQQIGEGNSNEGGDSRSLPKNARFAEKYTL